MKHLTKLLISIITITLIALPGKIMAQEKPQPETEKPGAPSVAKLAIKLANPIASLISVPFQNNTDYGIGPNRGSKNTMNFQPVIPITISPKLNLITRAIIPIITQNNVTSPNSKESGLGDAAVSGFLSPSQTKNGVTWGVGPVLLVPIATNAYLGTKKLGVGPTVIALKQAHGITVGVLANQIWTLGDNQGNGAIVNQFYIQPFTNYNWKSGAGVGLSAEISQNWLNGKTIATLIPYVSGVTKLGKQIVSIIVGPRIPLTAPPGLKPDFGWRAALIFVFPKK